MRITGITERAVRLRGGGVNAVVDFAEHTVSLLALRTDLVRGGRPVVGVAFNSIGRFSQGGILRDRMIPRVLAAGADTLVGEDGLLDPARVLAAAMRNEKPGGHGDRAGAAAALELAAWDAVAKAQDEPAHRVIARRFGRPPVAADGVAVYAAGGYYRNGSGDSELRAELAGYLDAGFDAVKIKIGGAPLAVDLRRIEVAVDVIGRADRVAVDANGRFDRTEAVRYATTLAPYGLRWFEEPGDPLDLALGQAVADVYPGPVATGENLFSRSDVENLLRFGGCRPNVDVLQMDPGLSYGLTEYGRMIETAERLGFARHSFVPHGGHLINLHVVAGLQLGGCEAYPGVFAPFGGYGRLEPSRGRLHPGEAPGFGLEEKADLYVEIAELLR